MIERDLANQLLAKFWSGKSLPIDPIAVANGTGVPVHPFGANEIATASGWYRVDNGKPAIYFNPTEIVERQRFTIAHELGHHVLNHGPRPRDTVSEFNVMNYDPVETSANRFAAELLMPAQTVKLLVGSGISSVRQLAEKFAVSEVAMKFRLKNLGLVA
jgi:Zn-dependent peptidase ImmA (M78 family)